MKAAPGFFTSGYWARKLAYCELVGLGSLKIWPDWAGAVSGLAAPKPAIRLVLIALLPRVSTYSGPNLKLKLVARSLILVPAAAPAMLDAALTKAVSCCGVVVSRT